MNVIVCDDSNSICIEINNYIKQNFNFNLFLCNNKTELLQTINSCNADIQAIILDIVLENEINGIDVANEIHIQFPNIKIIFLTGYDDMYYDKIFSTFQPYGFIAKPIQYNILNFFLRKLSLAYARENKTLDFVSNYKEYKIPIIKINFIQSIKRVCEIVTDEETFLAYLKISDIEALLSDDFIRCHQSYIVNLGYIKSIEKKQFVTEKNEFIPISKKYYHEAVEIYTAYLKKDRRSC